MINIHNPAALRNHFVGGRFWLMNRSDNNPTVSITVGTIQQIITLDMTLSVRVLRKEISSLGWEDTGKMFDFEASLLTHDLLELPDGVLMVYCTTADERLILTPPSEETRTTHSEETRRIAREAEKLVEAIVFRVATEPTDFENSKTRSHLRTIKDMITTTLGIS